MSDTSASNDDRDDAVTNDPVVTDAQSKQTLTNDAVAGETVLPGAGDGNNGPTGGSPGEAQPIYAENDLDADEIDLDGDGDGDDE